MHKLSFTQKPPEAGGIFNGLLSALVAGEYYGDYLNSISFANQVIDDDPDAAPRGYANPAYTTVPRGDVIDPTNLISIALRSSHRRNPTGTVGYTHHHVALEHLAHISSMFAKWVTEFNVLYTQASLAQQSINAGNYTRLDSVREARYTDGDIEAFLAAVGRLDDGNISYPANKTLDVDVIYSRVMSQLQAEIAILDNIGFTLGENEARKYIGIGTIPKTGQNVCVTSAATFDKLFAAPWKRILTIPRSRELIREPFMERLNIALDGVDYTDLGNRLFVTITEGDDVLYIPHTLEGARTTWESLTAAIDGRNPLSTTAQTLAAGDANSGMYGHSNDAANTFVDTWLNQFYDMGDLVQALMEGTLDAREAGLLSILLAPLITDVDAAGNPVNNAIVGEVNASTGALGSANVILPGCTNFISGSIDALGHEVTFTGLDNSLNMHSLPNGILYVGDCGSAKATSWIRILRSLRLNFPMEAQLLLTKTGRSKKTLALTANRIASMDSLISEAVSNGQRDGYINSPALAFNVTRLTRAEQEGPVVGGTLLSAANPGQSCTSPLLLSGGNGWDRTDNSDGRYIVNTDGATFNFEYGTPSRFTGEWDAGRFATWAPDFVSESIATGSGSLEVKVTRNLMCYPYAESAGGQIQPRYSVGSTGALGLTPLQILIDAANNSANNMSVALFDGVTEFAGYGSGLALESWSLQRGFMRGLASIVPNDNLDTVGFNRFFFPREEESLEDLGRITGVPAAVGATGYTSLPMASVPATSLPFNAYGAASLRCAPVNAWFWDPTRTQMLGPSVHRWAGVMSSDILPHPYLQHPVAITTAYVRVSDLVGRETPSEQNTSALLFSPQGSASFTSMGGYNVTASSDFVGDRVGVGHNWVANNASSSYQGYVNADVAADMGSGGVYANIAVPLADAVESIPLEICFRPLVNGCSRMPINRLCGTTIQRSDDEIAAGNCAGTLDTEVGAPWQTEGETITPVFTDASVAVVRPASSLIIRGKGLLFEGDVYTQRFLDLISWYTQTYTGEDTLVASPFSGFWAPWQDNTGFIGVSAPGIGSNFIGEPPYAPALVAFVAAGRSHQGNNLAVQPVMNDWFRKGQVLSGKHARMRARSLANPWVRGTDGAGYVHLRYDNSQLGPVFAALESSILGMGQVLVTGLTNSLFLEVQMAN